MKSQKRKRYPEVTSAWHLPTRNARCTCCITDYLDVCNTYMQQAQVTQRCDIELSWSLSFSHSSARSTFAPKWIARGCAAEEVTVAVRSDLGVCEKKEQL